MIIELSAFNRCRLVACWLTCGVSESKSKAIIPCKYREQEGDSILLFHIPPIPWLSLPPGWAIQIVISTVVAWALSGSVADAALDP